jgi:hypothetical protein
VYSFVTTTGHKVYYHDLIETLEYLLNIPNARFVWNYSNERTSYAWNTEGWKEYEDYFDLQLKNGMKLLLGSIFVDEYEGRRSKRKKSLAIYVTCTNMTQMVILYN